MFVDTAASAAKPLDPEARAQRLHQSTRVQPLHQSTRRVQTLHQSTPIKCYELLNATKLASLCLDPKCYELLNATKLASLCLDPKCYETCVLVPGTRERRQLLGRAMADSNMADGNQLPVLVMQLKVLPPCVVCLPVSPSVVCVSLCRLCQCLPVSCVSVSPSVVCVSLCLPAS